jgi:hypothetical protein
MKTESSMSDRREPDSNARVRRLLQEWKQLARRISTEEGMQIHGSAEHSANAKSPTHPSLERDSNETHRRRWHDEKQPEQRASVAEGMQIDNSDEHCENAKGKIRDS